MRCFSILVLGGPPALHVYMCPCPNTPDSDEWVVIRLQQIFVTSRSLLSGVRGQGNILNKQSRGPRTPGLKNHCPNGTSKVLWMHSLWLLIILGLDYTSHDASQRVDVWTHDYAVVITSTHYSWTAPCLIFELASCTVVSLNGQERLELGYSDPQLKLNVGHGFEIGGLLLFFLLSYLLHSGALARTMPITGISL